MAVKIRLARHGRKKAPHYRMVVADSRFPRDGRFLEILGIYHPQNKVEADQVRIDETKALKWLSVNTPTSERALGRKCSMHISCSLPAHGQAVEHPHT